MLYDTTSKDSSIALGRQFLEGQIKAFQGNYEDICVDVDEGINEIKFTPYNLSSKMF